MKTIQIEIPDGKMLVESCDGKYELVDDPNSNECTDNLEPREWLTVSDFCRLAKMARITVYQLIKQKKIPYYKPNGGKIYFVKSEVEEWLNRSRVEPAKL